MTEPIASKVTLLLALSTMLGQAGAEYTLILAAALIGGFAGLSLREEPLPGLLRPFLFVALGTGLAAVVVPAAVAVVLAMMPSTWALRVDTTLPVVSLAVGIWWAPALRAVDKAIPKLVERLLGRWLGGKQ